METFLANMMITGGPSAVVIGLGVLLVSGKLNALKESIEELKSGKRWTETCEATHEEVNRRLERLECGQNGGA